MYKDIYIYNRLDIISIFTLKHMHLNTLSIILKIIANTHTTSMYVCVYVCVDAQ